MRPWALQELQARHQARAQAPAQRGVRRRPQGDLHQDQRKPQEGRQARGQEVVLHAHPRVRSLLELWRNAQVEALTNRQSSLLALYIQRTLVLKIMWLSNRRLVRSTNIQISICSSKLEYVTFEWSTR